MKANIVDLRYKMKEVLKALNRKERVEIMYRGKSKGVIIPVHEPLTRSVQEHPFFGLSADDNKPVAEVMEDLRGDVTVLFDTDILIWIKRGNTKAAKLLDGAAERYISVLTRMELLQGAENKNHLSYMESFIMENGFVVLPLTDDIGHRALIYVEEYALSHGLRANDAIIAATAVENNLVLCSSNVKHFKSIKDLKFHPFHV